MLARLSWERDGRDWPNRAFSRFVQAGGLRWHVQQLGHGPILLLVHGTGAATHTWRALAPLLAEHFTVVAPDLPGHGFTEAPSSDALSLPGIADALHALLRALDLNPGLAAGHSAGAAILARMCLDGHIDPAGLLSLNGALLPMRGLAAQFFSPAAKLLARSSLVPRLFAWRAADRSAVERLIRGTGSTLDVCGVELYGRVISNPAHAAAALGMMANWNLVPLARDLPRLNPRLMLVTGDNDRTLPPSEALRARALLPSAERVSLPGLGHLAHEERPEEVAPLFVRLARTTQVIGNAALR